ncbi:MAG: TIGR03084 family metal-binding protein [Acidimicrobiia bacterium]
MSTGLAEVRADLEAECDSLDALVAGLDTDGWEAPTPAEGWTVKDQISHLASVDEWATLAAGDPEGFTTWLATLPFSDPDAVVNAPVDAARTRPGPDVLAWWRAARVGLAAVMDQIDPTARAPWFGPPMAMPTLLTARLMETWAHGEDVAEALGVDRLPTARLRHIAHLGVRTRTFAYASRGLPVPDTAVRVELTGPGGETWTWGEEAATARVTGSVLDFCRVVTRRRAPSDTALVIEGDPATEWLAIAQAFAGPAGKDPTARK